MDKTKVTFGAVEISICVCLLNTKTVSNQVYELRCRATLTKLHLLERLALGFFNEEPGIHNKRPVEDTKHQKRLPSEVIDSMWRNLRKCEIEQPLCSRSDSDASFTDASREDFAHVQLSLD